MPKVWLAVLPVVLCAASPDAWVPARWEGGPVELARRANDKALAADAVREAIANWYEPATLGLLEGTPINCLLVTASPGSGPAAERQQQLVQGYARAARERGIAVLGVVRPDADPTGAAIAATEAHFEGVVLDGEFPAGFVQKLEAVLREKNSAALVVPIRREAAPLRVGKAPLLAIEGVRPSARDLAEMGVRAGPSSEPWIESNIWLARSFRLGAARRTIWISQEPNPSALGDYVRCVADAAVGGGRWIVTPDDQLRARLFRKDPQALAAWKTLANYLKFAEEHAEWRDFEPYGNLAVILDTSSETPDIGNEYLNLVARRQVPYRVIERARLSAEALARFRAVLAVDAAPLTGAERELLRGFAEKGGLVIAGPSWGNAPKDDPYGEVTMGKGRVVVYKDDPPDPESVARDLLELLEPEVMGMSAFNVPSVLTYASANASGTRVLVQFLNYASSPFDGRMTIRVNGAFRTARLHTPESAPAELAVQVRNGRTQVTIPGVAVWGAVLLE